MSGTGWVLSKQEILCYVDRLAVKGTGNKVQTTALVYRGDFSEGKFIVQARQALLYEKIQVIVDPFLP